MTAVQWGLVATWLGPYVVLRDHSWPLQDTTVLEVQALDGERLIVKASTTSHHIGREIAAHRRGLGAPQGRVPALVGASVDAGILVTGYLPGELVQDTAAETDPATYRQAGELLAAIHQPAGSSAGYAKATVARTLGMLPRSRGLLSAAEVAAVRAVLENADVGPVPLVSTHGDFQPRNWLSDDGTVRVIDFGRADFRPWVHDLVRVTHGQFQGRPELRDAFLAGLERALEPVDQGIWQLENLLQAVGTVVWAQGIGDYDFAAQGGRYGPQDPGRGPVASGLARQSGIPLTARPACHDNISITL
ncbi:aminoglycoside phosphotransferase family protein [Pseudarthrobacter sp. PS3-L1]|uniref:phosphotransferase family protein n=1 Tax=Pseudarthrobacter sp. PS3-L1 TaxID=3046207 RepID=UPI0024B9297C|nr:aminoglycoside phosphotransferase family protein [Pseudarthrobacter sp. PS3-L1]MDJ0320742.1 aminoglycoside phosphotransferase family protein [Pseudarthrobacter sp. PS3-L1]